jgi:hypothetical protein
LKLKAPSAVQHLEQKVSAARVQLLSDALEGARQLRKLNFEDYYLFSSAGHFPHLTQLTSLSFWIKTSESEGPSALSQISALSGLQEVVVRGVQADQRRSVAEVLCNALPELTSLTLFTLRSGVYMMVPTEGPLVAHVLKFRPRKGAQGGRGRMPR